MNDPLKQPCRDCVKAFAPFLFFACKRQRNLARRRIREILKLSFTA
jgi:hypothetical protein